MSAPVFRFDPHSASFTLDSIIQLKLDQHVEFIAEMSVNATKELAIETNLKVGVQSWSSTSSTGSSVFCSPGGHQGMCSCAALTRVFCTFVLHVAVGMGFVLPSSTALLCGRALRLNAMGHPFAIAVVPPCCADHCRHLDRAAAGHGGVQDHLQAAQVRRGHLISAGELWKYLLVPMMVGNGFAPSSTHIA